MMSVQPPIAMLAELTHRCPLSCPYCSNPLEMAAKETELDTRLDSIWYDSRAFNAYRTPIDCLSPAKAVRAGRSISAAAAVRPWQ